MTKEEAIANLKMSAKYCIIPCTDAFNMAIKALEQEQEQEQDSILYKIILELEQAEFGCEYDSYCRGINYGLYIAKQIINKYCRRDYHE